MMTQQFIQVGLENHSHQRLVGKSSSSRKEATQKHESSSRVDQPVVAPEGGGGGGGVCRAIPCKLDSVVKLSLCSVS
ncbi:hypothetical protein E2C01_023402 [Portunus trituberculatus]|uniref:Uncharacterized protein n=1 Tax=Portunus trituberculatus TaxID=210409 RepID=A0A5B7EB18_PORTR|nr:hypothetical protein [Portunus trituberculatus]